MNGDEVRGLSFAGPATFGLAYDASQVDELLARIGTELDAGRPIRQLISSVSFRRPRGRGYDVGAVDWLLNELLRHEAEPARATSEDPWRYLPVAQIIRYSDDAVDVPSTARPRQAARDLAERRSKQFALECQDAWTRFAQLPGTQLRWERSGALSYRLRGQDQQELAAVHGRLAHGDAGSVRVTVRARGRSYRLKRTGLRPASFPADILSATIRDTKGNFLEHGTAGQDKMLRFVNWWKMARVLVDEAGTSVLYTSGSNFNDMAYSRISFPDRRWLRFMVRGTKPADAIMTAVDQSACRAVRFRRIGQGVEVVVHPQWQLTDELTLAIAISAPWLESYFHHPRGGG